MNLPTPQSVLGRAVERAFLVALSAVLADIVAHQTLGNTGSAGLAYFIIKTALDLLNKNIPNL